MDGTTEPVIAVIGHPIAGNPAQFAIERALLSMQLQWRVMSFDVPTDRVAAALDGLETLAFRGVLVDPSLATLSDQWYQEKASDETIDSPIGCLFRDPDNQDVFVGVSPVTTWLADQIRKQTEKHKIARAIWLGDSLPVFPQNTVEFSATSARKKISGPDSISSYDLVVISSSDGQALDLRIGDWSPSDGSTWVIDMTDGHPAQAEIKELGYRMLTAETIRVGMICEAMQHWTGQRPECDVVQEAIEEYLAM